jgi:hypothetical protein
MENTLIFIFQVEKHNVKKRNLGEYTWLDPNYFLEYIIRILYQSSTNQNFKKRRLLLWIDKWNHFAVAKRRQEGFNKFIKLRD